MALQQGEENLAEDPLLNWSGPHTITIPRNKTCNQGLGFGFSLRHLVVNPPDTSRAVPFQFYEDEESDNFDDQSDHGSKCGLEPMDTIFVRTVNNGGSADQSGLNIGDKILSVNGESVNGKSYQQVLDLIQQSENSVRLLVIPRNEDILQMAYPGSQGFSTGTSVDLETPQKSTNQTSPYRPHPVDENSAPVHSRPTRKDTPYKFEATHDYNPRPSHTSKKFYSSDSRVYRQPLRNDDSENKVISFTDRKIDRPVSEDSGGKMASITIPSKNTYSYGLIIPPKDDGKSSSVDNLSRNVSGIKYSRENSGNGGDNGPVRHRRLNYDNRQSSADSDSNLDVKASVRVTQSGRHSYTEPTTSFIISRSKTTSALANPTNRGPKSIQYSSRRGSDNGTESTGSRHIVPVVSEMGKASPFSTSVDSIDLRTGRYKQELAWQPSQPSIRDRERDHDNNNSGRTFVVRIPVSDRQQSVDSPSRSGTTFALTRSPVTQIEIHKSTVRPTVVHRKQQFEEGKNENIPPRNVNVNRYKTEIEKLSSLKKFSSVANRTAQFETKSDASATTSSDESSSPPLGTRNRKLSDQFRPKELQSQSHNGHKAERPTTLTNYSESAPIRIYVSPGSSSAPSSPIVEIVPLFSDQNSNRETNQRPTSYPQNSSEDNYDGYHARIVHENVHNNRPVRKTSYLSAVNAPRPRYSDENSSSPESPGVNSVVSSGDGSVVISRVETVPHHTLSNSPPEQLVKYRKKTPTSLEEETLKLHRRTSYLMATAKDRSNINQQQTAVDPNIPQQQQHQEQQQQQQLNVQDDTQTPPNKNISLRKLKNFFGEKDKQETPSILEATEPQEPPESPLPHVTKEGLLLSKTAVTDGKKSSDRSWRPLWVVLRGHALYLCKDKKEGSSLPSFEDQLISIKSCLIDIAHDYAKKKRNVFRLSTFNGSEYLFQTEDRGTMMSWIQAIKTNNDPDCDKLSVTSSDLISRKIASHELSQPITKNSPTVPPKGKKLSGLKKLTGSPSVRRKKSEKEKDETKTKTWKKMMPKGFKKTSESQAAPVEVEEDSNRTFGVELKDCIPSPNNEFVPLIVELCARIVEARGLEVVGVYRVPGNSISVNAMQDDLNKGIENISIDNEKWLDVNVIASLLKAFFRKLPESLITDKCYDAFIAANRIENPEKRMLRIKRMIQILPEHHFETLKYMAEHLSKVASYGHMNKMDAKNLAIMFGPTLVRKSNDDTLSMVTDMSDQCRIVESIILHYEWFFSSWDHDDHVPLEQQKDTSPPCSSADTSRVLKDDDEELDSQIYAREIVSSIITAANRKLKSKETSKSCDELDCSPPAYSDLDLRRQGPPPPYSHSQSKHGITTSFSEEFLDRKPPRPVPVYDRKPPPPPPPYEQEWQMIFQKADPNSRAFTRHYSEDSLMDRNDELEMSHSLDTSWNLSRDTLDRLRKIKKDTSLIIEREEQRRKDMEKRRQEQQRYEQEYQRTKEEMEREDSHSVEDLLNLRFSDFTSKINSMSSKPETSPPYSSNQSKGGRNQGYLLARAHPVICGTRSDSDIKDPSSSSDRAEPVDSGKYFISIGNTRARDKPTKSGMLGSLDSLAPCVPRAGSLENMLDTNPHHVHGKYSDHPHNYRRSRNYDTDPSKDSQHRSNSQKRHPRTLNRNSAAYRHGSLDSLIDLLDKQDRNSWASTDSEDGLDLLTDLTTTFDQKLQILSNPKYKLNGSSRKSRTDPSSASASTISDVLDEKDLDLPLSPETPPSYVEQKSQPVILPRYPQNLVMSTSNVQDKKFQDPSLHRSHKSETKIGIASRFERNPQLPTGSQATNPSSTGTISLVQWTCNPSEIRRPVSKKLTSPLSLSHSNKDNNKSNKDNNKYSNSSKIFKSEQPQKREVTFSTENQIKNNSNCQGETSTNTKRSKRGIRRHTVGGIDDWENIKTIMAAQGTKDEISAWEQLQPAIRDNSMRKNRNLNLWLQKERLRGSTPDLSSLGLMKAYDRPFYL